MLVDNELTCYSVLAIRDRATLYQQLVGAVEVKRLKGSSPLTQVSVWLPQLCLAAVSADEQLVRLMNRSKVPRRLRAVINVGVMPASPHSVLTRPALTKYPDLDFKNFTSLPQGEFAVCTLNGGLVCVFKDSF